MKMLSKANCLFLFYPVVDKSENHWRELAHCTLQRQKMAALELRLVQNADVSIYFEAPQSATDEPFQ